MINLVIQILTTTLVAAFADETVKQGKECNNTRTNGTVDLREEGR
jgi:hypothetical protein